MALPKLITRDHLEHGLLRTSDRCHHPDAGLFGPGSICWQLMRENLMCLAQGRVLLLALTDSRTAQLVTSENDLMQRLQHTQMFMLKLVFGNLEQALLTLQSPRTRRKTLFDVDDSDTLLYMLSAWMDSCLRMYQSVIEPLSSAHQERLFEETMVMAEAMGIAPQRLPGNWHAHRRWWHKRLARNVDIPQHRRQLGHTLIREHGFPGRLPYGNYLSLASFQIPECLREQFRLPQTGLDAHRRYQKHIQRLMELTCRLPERLRFQPAYHEALQRLNGRPRGDLPTRLLNRWWSGESNLVSSGWSIPKIGRLQTLGS